MIRPVAFAKIESSTGPISRSGVTKPGISALVESDSSRSTPSAPSRAKPARSVIRPSSGSWSILKSPVCSTSAGRRADGDRERVRDGVVDREELAARTGRAAPCRPRRTVSVYGSIRRSASFASTRASVNWEPTSGMSGLWAEQVRHRADVVLVTVGEHDRLDVVEPVQDRREVGQDQVHAGLRPRPGTAPRSRRSSSLPSYSKTVMLRPMAPSPPSGMTRRPPSGSGGGSSPRGAPSVTRPPRSATPSAGVHRVARSCGQVEARRRAVRAQLGQFVGGRVHQRRAYRAGGQTAQAARPALTRIVPWRAEDAGEQRAAAAGAGPARSRCRPARTPDHLLGQRTGEVGRGADQADRRRRRAAAGSARPRRSSRRGRCGRAPRRSRSRSPLASLTATIRLVLGQPAPASRCSIGTPGAARDVVDHDRQPGGVRDRGEVPQQPGSAAACCSTA